MKTHFFNFTSTLIITTVLLSEAVLAQDISHKNVKASTPETPASPRSDGSGGSKDDISGLSGILSGLGGEDKSALEAAIIALGNKRDKLISEKALLESKNTNLESQLADLISDKVGLETGIKSLTEQVQVLKGQLTAMGRDDKTGPLLEEITKLRDKILTLDIQLEEARNSSNPIVDNSKLLKDIARLNDRIRTLEAKLENASNPTTPNSGLVKEIADLKFQNTNQTEIINKLNQMLKDPLEKIQQRDNVIKTQTEYIKKLNTNLAALQSSPGPIPEPPHPPQPPKWPWQAATVALGALAIGLGAVLLLRKPKTPLQPSRPNQNSLRSPRPSKPLERPDNVGALFAGSPLLAANVAAPLSAAGQLTASSLQMLSGPFAVLRPAYQATGRIGYAQEGKPTSEDYAFGTGFLVTPNHVITNRHVHGFYSEYLTGDDCGGIEFIAEKDKDASDFYEFDGNPPVLIPGLDIAIYTLAKTVENREPIARVPLPTDSLEGRDIVVVGYPDTFNPDDPEVLAALEDDPVFAVKRLSQGQIFRHSSDIDDPYGVQATVTEDETTEFPMPAISHNASTMTGNSGSPILDAKTGELLGVHFAGYKIFNKKEAANLAMAIEYIVRQQETHSNLKTSTGLQTA